MTTEYTITFPQDQLNTLANLLQLICVAGLEFNGRGNAIPTVDDLKPIWQTIIKARLTTAQESDRATELEYLKYFADKVVPCLGPADSDIVQMIKERFMQKTGKKMPKGYEIDEEQEDEEKTIPVP